MTYPEFLRSFPRVDLDLPGVEGYMVAGEKGLSVFWEFTRDTAIPPHAHGAQWGHLFSGRLVITISGETRTILPGDSFFVPAGAVHSVVVDSGTRVMDLFEDRDRYAPRRG